MSKEAAEINQFVRDFIRKLELQGISQDMISAALLVHAVDTAIKFGVDEEAFIKNAKRGFAVASKFYKKL